MNALKNRRRIFIVVSLLILLSDTFFVAMNYFSSKEALQASVEQHGDELRAEFNITFDLTTTYMQQAALFVASDDDVQQLFLNGQQAVMAEGGGSGGEQAEVAREALHQEVEQLWSNLIENYDLRQLHFHLGPGSTSFLRMHRPEKFGDNMDNIRYTIVDANRLLVPTRGFETGRVYSGIRGVVPLFAIDPESEKEVHVGAVEVGVSFSRILQNLDDANNAGFAVLLTVDHMQKNMWADFLDVRFATSPPIGDFAIESTSREEELQGLLATQRGYSVLLEQGTEILSFEDGISYGVTAFDLRDYRGSVDESLPPVGVVYIWKDMTEDVGHFEKGVRNNIIYAVLAFLFFELLFYFALKYLTARLQAAIDEQTEIIREMAIRDQLTGLYNRHCLFDKVSHEMARVDRTQSGFSVAMLDLDHFKEINDNYGHPKGDEVLREVAAIIRKRIRKNDIAFRVGGEEFLILLIDAPLDDAAKVCGEFCDILSSKAIAGLNVGEVTASIGVTSYIARSGENYSDLEQRADIALYQAKANGRNRVERSK